MRNSRITVFKNNVIDESNAKLLVICMGILYWCYGIMPYVDIIFNAVILFCLVCMCKVIFHRRMQIRVFISLLIGAAGIITFLLNPFNTITILALIYIVVATGLMTYCDPYKDVDTLKKELTRAGRVFHAFGLAVIIISLIMYFAGISMDYQYPEITTSFLHLGRSGTTGALTGILANANIASDLCVIFIGITLYLLRATSKGRVLYLLSTLLALIMLFLTFSRGGYIGVIVLFAVTILLDLKGRVKSDGYWFCFMLFFTISVIGLMILISSDVFVKLLNSFSFTGRQSLEMENSTGARILMWQTGWKALTSDPAVFVFGVGATIRDRISEFAPAALPEQLYNNMHNIYMQTLTAFGCTGLVLMLSQIFYLLRITFQRMMKEIQYFWELIPLFALETGILVINLVESDIYMKKSFEGMTFWIILGYISAITCGRIRISETEERTQDGD